MVGADTSRVLAARSFGRQLRPEEVPNAGHPYGVRGVGEVPIVPPLAAIGNAIHDATSVRVTQLPVSPRWLLDQLERAGE